MDSGAEVWHLKALNRKDFEGWREALERPSATVSATSAPKVVAQNSEQMDALQGVYEYAQSISVPMRFISKDEAEETVLASVVSHTPYESSTRTTSRSRSRRVARQTDHFWPLQPFPAFAKMSILQVRWSHVIWLVVNTTNMLMWEHLLQNAMN